MKFGLILFLRCYFCLKGNIFITVGQRPAVMKITAFQAKFQQRKKNSTSKKELTEIC